MITVGPMQLNQPQAADPMEPFFLGTQVGGGYWNDVSRLSSHDHSGGLMGAAVAVSIPDGSITAADLDPSVLAPYARTDGSAPFTGQVTMQADAVVRDAVLFGQQGTALAPDASLTRTAAGVLTAGGTLRATGEVVVGAAGLQLETDAASRLLGFRTAAGGYRWRVGTDDTGQDLWFYSYDDAGAGTGRTLRVARATGTLTVGTNATTTPTIIGGGPNFNLQAQAGGNVTVQAPAGVFHPLVDNSLDLGYGTFKWKTVYATTGTISTSSREAKEAIVPLAPQRAMAAVRATEAVTFDYTAPRRPAAYYELPDDPEQAEAVLRQRLTGAPLEAAARHQHGFVAEQADPLFLVGEGQTAPGSSIGVLLAALQHLDARVQQLEGAA